MTWNVRLYIWILFWVCKIIYNSYLPIFSYTHSLYYDKWPPNLNKSYIFPYLEKGSNYLLKEFPNEKTYKDSKEKIEDL